MANKTLPKVFETRKRDDGSEYVVLVDNCEHYDTLKDWIRESHFAQLPNDRIYSMCEEVYGYISDAVEELDTEDEVRERVQETIQNQVIYNAEARAWFKDCFGDEHIDRMIEEYGSDYLCVLKDRCFIDIVNAGLVYHYERILNLFPLNIIFTAE